jgi:hypothetical protein
MMGDFERERRGIESAWARRAKRHEQLVRAIAGLYGDIGGITGTLPKLRKLELPAGEDEQAA